MAADRRRIVILGGGCAGVAAAFWLTSTEALRQRFEVTVVTRGWRLGGKGASGRNAAQAQRIEEHGLHVWMGCYENAFRTVRACYDELPDRPERVFKRWSDAFAPQFEITLTERAGANADIWKLWKLRLPKRSGTPGDGEPLAWIDPLLAFGNWLARARPGRRDDPGAASPASASSSRPSWLRRFAALIVLALVRIATWLLQALHLIVAAAAAIASAVAPARLPARWCIGFDLALALAVGVLRDILPFGDGAFARIDALDFRAWLDRHGASRAALASAPVRALYDLGFAYPDGDASDFANGRGSAGAAMRFLLELGLGYKGAPLWKMNAGMGDAVFAPMYEVLLERGVRFRFFRNVSCIDAADPRGGVTSIVLERQVDLKGSDYCPLVRVGGLDCWPSEPLWDQLRAPAGGFPDAANFESFWDRPNAGEETLVAGRDFDAAVIAFPPEVIRRVAPRLAEHSLEWQRMLDHSTSVATQAFQVWLAPSLAELGWDGGPAVLSAYASPFDSWADMSHLLGRERWSGDGRPQTIAYLCGALPTPRRLRRDPVKSGTRQVQLNAEQWLLRHSHVLWPGLSSPEAKERGGPILASYFRCNIDPSERYVQSLPGVAHHRLAPGSLTFANLYLAGDWTRTRYNSGSVEAAFESGMRAAEAAGATSVPLYGAMG